MLDSISAAWRDALDPRVACDEEDMLQEIRASALYVISEKCDSVVRGRLYLRDLQKRGGARFLYRSRGFLEAVASLSCDVIDPPDWLRRAELDAANALDKEQPPGIPPPGPQCLAPRASATEIQKLAPRAPPPIF